MNTKRLTVIALLALVCAGLAAGAVVLDGGHQQSKAEAQRQLQTALPPGQVGPGNMPRGKSFKLTPTELKQLRKRVGRKTGRVAALDPGTRGIVKEPGKQGGAAPKSQLPEALNSGVQKTTAKIDRYLQCLKDGNNSPEAGVQCVDYLPTSGEAGR